MELETDASTEDELDGTILPTEATFETAISTVDETVTSTDVAARFCVATITETVWDVTVEFRTKVLFPFEVFVDVVKLDLALVAVGSETQV